MKARIVWWFAVPAVMGTALGVEVTKTGTTAASFLSIGVGARALGMGGAYVSAADDATAMYWNPSGMARMSRPQALFSHTRWIFDVRLGYAGVAVPAGRFGTIGASAVFLTMDEMERTTIQEPEGTGETFGAGSYALGLSYARNLTDRFSIGVTAKFIQENIYHSSARAVAFDVGTLFTTAFHGLSIGMSISNYGTKMQMGGRDMLVQHDINPLVTGNNPNINARLETDAFDLPLLFRIGMSMDMLRGRGGNRWVVSMDALHPNDDRESLNVGTEFVLRNTFALRAGYKSLLLKDSEQGLCFGAGLRYPVNRKTVVFLDFTFQEFGVLKDVQRYCMGIEF